MTLVLRFVVPGDPIPKGRARVTERGTFTPKRTRAYEKSAGLFALQARQSIRSWPLDEWYRCEMRIITRTRRIPDADNVGKAVLDGCSGILWKNDRTVSAPHSTLYEVCSDDPRVEVVVTVVEPPIGWLKGSK